MFGKSILLNKSLDVAVFIFKTASDIKKLNKEYDITSQIIRSSGSICANIAEAKAAGSQRDFIAKLLISRKEYYETLVWVEYLLKTSLIDENLYLAISNQLEEIGKMLNKSISTSRKTLKN